jgi:hypothetical protein
MRSLAVLLGLLAATSLGAQQPTPPPDSVRAESTAAPALVPPVPTPPAPPTPEQRRFLDGLRTATRGIAQLKDGVSRVTRATTRDSLSQRRAGRLLAGECGSSRAFLKRGRPRLTPTVYSDTVRLLARRLVTQIDSLIAYSSNCEQEAVATPGSTAAELGKRMKNYDAALRDFRVAIGLPVKEDTVKTVKTPRRQPAPH